MGSGDDNTARRGFGSSVIMYGSSKDLKGFPERFAAQASTISYHAAFDSNPFEYQQGTQGGSKAREAQLKHYFVV